MPLTMEELLAEAHAREKLKPPRRHPHDEEHRLQCACVRWFRYQYPELTSLLFAVPNGGRRDATTAAKLKAEGVVAGVSDLILLVKRGGYGGLLIEMKTDKGRQSPEQKAWQKEVERQGYLYKVCRNLDDFIAIIREYLSQD